MIDIILSKCDERYEKTECGECMDCTFYEYCPGDCEVCLDYIHNPSHSPANNLIVFQYVFSDMRKHTNKRDINYFMDTFAQYFNEKVNSKTYIILNDINLGRDYGGGREYFDQLYRKLRDPISREGRFCNDNSRSVYYPRGYTYGENSDGEFPQNKNFFDLRKWKKYSPFDTCASAQMLIEKR